MALGERALNLHEGRLPRFTMAMRNVPRLVGRNGKAKTGIRFMDAGYPACRRFARNRMTPRGGAFPVPGGMFFGARGFRVREPRARGPKLTPQGPL